METILYSYHFSIVGHLFSLLIPVLLGSGMLIIAIKKKSPEEKEKETKWDIFIASLLRIIASIFGPLILVAGIWAEVDLIKEHFQYKEIYKSGEMYVVEGLVEDFHPMPFSGHDIESFTVNDVYFQYNGVGEIVNGYNRPKCYGGVVEGNGQHLKIKYIMNEDAGLEGVTEHIILYIAEIKE